MILNYLFFQVKSLNLQNVSIWTITATIAAIVSAYSAFKSRGFARRAYELAKKNYNDKQANFSLYLIDAYRWTTNNKPKRKFLLFHITVLNKSDSKSSFKGILEIEYIRNDNSVARVILSHDENFKENIPQKNISVFFNDIRIEEKGMQSKWLIFEQPQNIFKDYRIEKYSIKLTDTQGNNQITECSIMKELTYETDY